ncbi:MAG: helix-turn-helix domain-containing protein, partial [Ruminococcus bicirculans]|nr:helix-turn-helix domain-containing protein [Ruminococcus bicirculans (ex Wegman et al. 2014)]
MSICSKGQETENFILMRQIIITNSRGCLDVSKKNVETEKLFLTLNEACKMLRLSRPTLVKLIKQGKIKAFKPSIRVWR